MCRRPSVWDRKLGCIEEVWWFAVRPVKFPG